MAEGAYSAALIPVFSGVVIDSKNDEEAADFVEMSKENNISPILLAAPNTPDSRIQEISKSARDLIYCVAILGITGTQSATYEQLKSYLNRIGKNSSCPYIVGFGINTRSDVININEMAHGAVVGSAIIREMEKTSDPVECVKNYIGKMLGCQTNVMLLIGKVICCPKIQKNVIKVYKTKF